jgi:hypothetical protein
MPPGEREPLSTEQVALLRAWIDQGAKWPRADTTTTTAKSDHWAFQPITNPKLPRVKDEKWVRVDLDRFVLARLEKEGLAPAPEADRLTLMRRVYLDLTGLLPSPEEVERYQQDTRPGAYAVRTRGSSIGCWPRLIMESAGGGAGLMRGGMPIAMGMRRIRAGRSPTAGGTG